MTTREVPTHLYVEDQILAGLTVRQLLYVVVGAATGYWVWQNAGLPLVPRIACAALATASGLALALIQPDGQPLATWLTLLVVFTTTPRHAVWRRSATDVTPSIKARRQTRPRHPDRATGLATRDSSSLHRRAA